MTRKKGAASKKAVEQIDPRHAATKHVAPKQLAKQTPRQAPKQASKEAASQKTASKQSALKPSTPKQTGPEQIARKQVVLNQFDPRQTAPQQAVPKQAPKQAHNQVPGQSAPKEAVPKKAPGTPVPRSPVTSIARTFDPLKYTTAEELLEIDMQLAATLKGVEILLFWTGVEWAHVQRWAKVWKLKTLTIAMGPLMDPSNPNSPKAQKSKAAYSKYVKGASGRFAQYARQHCRVIVLTNPPPRIYSDRENNTYQHLEEPILKGLFGDPPVRRIDYVHPTVDGAAYITYQAWPCDKSREWAIPFGGKNVKNWKKLNWSYRSLTTTSQIVLQPLQEQIPPADSRLPIPTPQLSTELENMSVNKVLRSHNSPDVNANDTNVEPTVAEDRDIAPPRQDVELVEEGRASPVCDIGGHESQIFATGPRPSEPASSASHLADIQVRDQVYQQIDFHEEELLCELDRSLTPAYTKKRCPEPLTPITVPVICIDDLAVGVEVTVDINEYNANEIFLYLMMKSTSGFEKWWNVSWAGDK